MPLVLSAVSSTPLARHAEDEQIIAPGSRTTLVQLGLPESFTPPKLRIPTRMFPGSSSDSSTWTFDRVREVHPAEKDELMARARARSSAADLAAAADVTGAAKAKAKAVAKTVVDASGAATAAATDDDAAAGDDDNSPDDGDGEGDPDDGDEDDDMEEGEVKEGDGDTAQDSDGDGDAAQESEIEGDAAPESEAEAEGDVEGQIEVKGRAKDKGKAKELAPHPDDDADADDADADDDAADDSFYILDEDDEEGAIWCMREGRVANWPCFLAFLYGPPPSLTPSLAPALSPSLFSASPHALPSSLWLHPRSLSPAHADRLLQDVRARADQPDLPHAHPAGAPARVHAGRQADAGAVRVRAAQVPRLRADG